LPAFESFDSLRPYRIWAGAVARAVVGERLTMALIDIEPNSDVPEHAHEQADRVLERRFVGLAEAGQIHGEHLVVRGQRLKVVVELDGGGAAQPVHEEQRGSLSTAQVVNLYAIEGGGAAPKRGKVWHRMQSRANRKAPGADRGPCERVDA